MVIVLFASKYDAASIILCACNAPINFNIYNGNKDTIINCI